jgi:hypothetical protein
MPDELALARGWFLKSVTARLLAANNTRFSVPSGLSSFNAERTERLCDLSV